LKFPFSLKPFWALFERKEKEDEIYVERIIEYERKEK